jgi:hypothetical protein
MLGDTIGAQTLGAGLLGGATSAALGQGFLPGALQAGSMSSMTPGITKMYDGAKGLITGPNGIFPSTPAAAINPATSGGLNQVSSGLLTNSAPAATDVAGSSLLAPNSGGITLSGVGPTPLSPASNLAASNIAAGTGLTGGTNLAGATLPGVAEAAAPSVAGAVAGAAKDTGILGTGISGSNALMGLTMLGGLTPPQALQQIEGSGLTPEQKATMSRALTDYTARWNKATLPTQGTPEYDDMMQSISKGIEINYMNPTITNNDTGVTQPMKKGGRAKAPAGGLSQIAMLASGTGSGRDDTINARLSDGEYVIDAETVALLGNGSTKAGAAVLDQMREQVRKQKGKALARGKFSPDAKSPLAYMKGGLK